MSKRSKRKGHVTKRRDGSTYRQDRPAVIAQVPIDDLVAQVREDVDREKRLRILQGLA